MRRQCFNVNITADTVYGELSRMWGQAIVMTRIGFRDGNDMDAAMVLGLYIQEMARRWGSQHGSAAVIAKRHDRRERSKEEA